MAKQAQQQNKKKLKISTVLIFLFCCIVAFTMLVPFVWMVSASFKLNSEIFSYPVKWIPEVFRTLNYEKVWQSIPFLQYFLNTLKLAVIITLLQLFTCSLAAFAFTKLQFPGRDKIFLLYLATMMIPPQLLMVPKFLMFKEMGIYNTHWALILPAAFSIYGVFMVRQYMMQIPDELSEAARIDGAGDLRICFQIIAPLCKPAMVTLVILFFTWSWNDYDNALIFINDKALYTINLGLVNFMDETGLKYSLIMAASVISILPIFIIFLVAQKYFIGGLTAGSVKG